MSGFFIFTMALVVIFSWLVAFNYVELMKSNGKHHIEYADRKLVVDGFWVVASFRSRSLNCDIFEYLNANQGREIFIDELEKHVFKGRVVVLSKIVDSLGVRGDLKKILFSLTAESITYHPGKLSAHKVVRIN